MEEEESPNYCLILSIGVQVYSVSKVIKMEEKRWNFPIATMLSLTYNGENTETFC